MAFDPDKYLAENAPKQAFDPDAYLAAQGAQTPSAAEKSTYKKINDAVFAGARHIPILGTAFNPAVQDAALRGLDYLAGNARTGIAGAAGVATKDDLYNALKGKAPRSSEYLARTNLPAGPKIPLTDISARDAAGFVGDIATDPLTYVAPISEIAGIGKTTAAAGKSMYKSGLKRVDEEVAKYGKDPVSDLLMKERVTGSAKSIADQMESLAARRKIARDTILEAATQRNAETDVFASLKPSEDFIANLRNGNDRRLDPVISQMQSQVDTLKKSAGRAAIKSTPEIRATSLTPELFELPVSRTQAPLEKSRMLDQFNLRDGVSVYEAPTLSSNVYSKTAEENARGKMLQSVPVLKNRVDKIYDLPQGGNYESVRPANFELGQVFPEYVIQDARPSMPAIKGPSPIQMSSMKSNTYNAIGDAAYNEAKKTPIFKQFEKAVAAGQRAEVERTVGNALGLQTQSNLTRYNDDLGRLLTSQEVADQAARIEGRKNAFTSVDGAMLGAALAGEAGGSHSLSVMGALKKLTDITKESQFRTTAGLAIQDLGQTRIPDVLLQRALINQNNPWQSVK